jgi:hypothetical protein
LMGQPLFICITSSSTYGNYCEVELFRKIKYPFQHTDRLVIIFDVYRENS